LGEAVVLCTRSGKFALVVGALGLFSGCQMVGPFAIDQGRDRYNNVIQETSKHQALANIVRVRVHEPILYMDVSEVDATTTVSGAATGGAANIGAKLGTTGGTLAGQTESVSGGVTYSESPLVRYQPLLGQNLVAQLTTPVGPEALGSLFDSSWGAAPLLAFAASFLTMDADESYAALNIIAKLSDENAVEWVAEKSNVTKSDDTAQSTKLRKGKEGDVILEVTNKASGAGTKDALVIYFLPFHPHATTKDFANDREEVRLWGQLLEFYAGTQSDSVPAGCPSLALEAERLKAVTKGSDLERIRSCLPNFIELRTMPLAADKIAKSFVSGAPVMRTYSALGILKNAVEQPWPRIAFITSEAYTAIHSHVWNSYAANPSLTFYTLLPCEEEVNDEAASDKDDCQKPTNITQEVVNWLKAGKPTDIPFVYDPKKASIDEYVKSNARLGHLRRYILIIQGAPPPDAYVSYFDRGTWYYIAGDDDISQKNFNLISLFMTMMAIPSATPPLSPSINVGGM